MGAPHHLGEKIAAPFETAENIRDAITIDELRNCFEYQASDGALIWKFRTDRSSQWNGRFAGKRAGHLHSSGYRRVGFNGVTIGEQRVIWAIVHGAWPEGMVDHRNGNTADNRIGNLRVATSAQNSWNRAPLGRCRTGSKGVYRVKATGRFHASIMAHGVRRHLGSYATLDEATKAYAAAASVLHGDFARGADGSTARSDIEIIRPAHPRQSRAGDRLKQIAELHAVGHRTSAIVRFTSLSKPTVKRHLALIRKGAGINRAEGSRILLDREGA